MKKLIKILGFLFVAALCAVYFMPAMQSYSNIPDEIYIRRGSQKTIDLGLPVRADLKSAGVISITGQTLAEAYGMQAPLVIESLENGDATIELSLLGLPVKSVRVNVTEDIMVIPGGQSIGVTLYTKGALVVGITGVELSQGTIINPAREAGMLPGDVIVSINGVEVENADHVAALINDSQGLLNIVVDRNNRLMNLNIKPAVDMDGKMRLGVWIRDSTAGVGTLTFVEPNGRWFGALGHAICDLDTGSVLSVKQGEIYFSQIIQIYKGESGMPGEIQGLFTNGSDTMGLIMKNTDYGIYGKMYNSVEIEKFSQPVAVARHDEVQLGKASILCTIDDSGVKEFSCEIIKISEQSTVAQKGLVIKITDNELLEKTGGIVQGMSGSPILQNGKLVGAVTHVFINNPAKGYGLFADWMLDQMN